MKSKNLTTLAIVALAVLLGVGCGSSEEKAAAPTPTCRMYELTLHRALVDRSQAHLADDLDPDTVSTVAMWWEDYEANKIELRGKLGWTPRSVSPSGDSVWDQLAKQHQSADERELDRRMVAWAKGEVTEVTVEEAFAAGNCIR